MKQNYITEADIQDANRKFDAQYVHFLKKGFRIRSAWNAGRFLSGKPLTNKKISQYTAQGYYSSDLRQARLAYQARKRYYMTLAR